MSKTFLGADKLMTTFRGGPSMVDIQHRKIGSLTTGKLLDECDIDDVPDDELNRELAEKDNIRVEVTLRNALALFERKGTDVAEIFSQAQGLPRDREPKDRWRNTQARLEPRSHNE